jgi:hypothetical protein
MENTNIHASGTGVLKRDLTSKMIDEEHLTTLCKTIKLSKFGPPKAIKQEWDILDK